MRFTHLADTHIHVVKPAHTHTTYTQTNITRILHTRTSRDERVCPLLTPPLLPLLLTSPPPAPWSPADRADRQQEGGGPCAAVTSRAVYRREGSLAGTEQEKDRDQRKRRFP
ncbi:hypothetical protein XELAEV_18027591mg [Xenopus laevis]|uniref:Uncharacterized protein n=1 Tax=Xenopus laevis TaxID=8355 RepID=A0A974HJW1_XENLA|nr:hypothetical protein XELAEV_18027591mg [Xenopus laevis]